MKQCSKCGETKDSAEFYVDRTSKNGLQSRCISCDAARRKGYARDTLVHTHSGRRRRARKKGVPYEFETWQDLEAAVGNPDGSRCQCCRTIMWFTRTGNQNSPTAPSLDEILPGMGYRVLPSGALTCWWICLECNRRKSNSTPADMYQIADATYRVIKERGLRDAGTGSDDREEVCGDR